MRIATISSKRQITIPKELLAQVRLDTKGKVLIESKKGVLVLKPIKRSIVEETAGSLAKFVDPAKRGKSFKEIREETQRIVAKELAEEQ